MPVRDPSDITPLQARILDLAWEHGEVTVADVREGLHPEHVLARPTVAVVLGRMERYGWLSRRRTGREFTYSPMVDRSGARQSHVRKLVRMLFPEDLPSLVSHALREGDWEAADLDRIEALVDEYRRRGTGEGG
ncbi:MAG: BlaI/MecI/CopY family transcriptional regulator [Gemmatimonadetes bacterium]|nr:BlaI/MecI/CopY family transcriptional regulator [Gemmatimonadota bacterium]